MDQKDLAFVFLSLIIVYSASFAAVLETTEDPENTNNPNHNTDNNELENNSNHNAFLPINLVYNLLSNLPTISKQNDNTQSPASSPSLLKSPAASHNSHNSHNSPQNRIDSNSHSHTLPHSRTDIDNCTPPTSTIHPKQHHTMSSNTDNDEIMSKKAENRNPNPLLLIEPHKPGLSTLSGNQHHIVEYHDVDATGHHSVYLTTPNDIPTAYEIPTTLSNTILDNANLLITTVDGKFTVLSAEHGSKQMHLDSSNQPLYQSPGTTYENQVIPGIDGQLYLLRKNPSDEEYLEPLPFTIEQLAANTGYADSFNTWYLVDPQNTVFWIDINQWQVCKPAGNIPDITDENPSNDIPACNEALIVTRIDRQITAVNVDSDIPQTQWRFKHGEYRVAAKYLNTRTHSHALQSQLQRFQLWQSLDENSKYMLFLYDRERGKIKWSKTLSSIVTNVKLLSANHEIFNFYVYHSKNALATAKHLLDNGQDIGLWIVPSDKDTRIAIAHCNRNPLLNHMFLPDIGCDEHVDAEDDEDDDIIDEDIYEDIKIIDEENVDPELTQLLKSAQRTYGNGKMHGDKVRFVQLSFDGDLETETNIPSPAIEFAHNNMPSWPWQHSLQNHAQKYAQASALKIFNPKQGLLSMHGTHSKSQDIIYTHDEHEYIQHYVGKNIITLSFFIAALFLYLTPLRFGIKKLIFGAGTGENMGNLRARNINLANNAQILPIIPPNNNLMSEQEQKQNGVKTTLDNDVKVVGKFRYNVKMKLGAGRRGHVFCGTFEQRQVAIKRIDKENNVDNEIDILLKVDHQANIVRYYAKESDNEFDYIALDLCLCSLWDVIKSNNNAQNTQYLGRKIPRIEGINKPIMAHEIPVNSLSISGKHALNCSCEGCRTRRYRPNNYRIPLRNVHSKHLMSHGWRRKNKPPEAVPVVHNKSVYKHLRRHKFVCESVQKMCGEMLDGLIALHTAKDGCIIHRDIKPQNILIAHEISENECKSNNYTCKLADMGMAKLMGPTRMSFDSENCGTLFWNAPELIYHKSISNLKQTLLSSDLLADNKSVAEIMQINQEKDINNSLKSIFGAEKIVNLINDIIPQSPPHTETEADADTESDGEDDLSDGDCEYEDSTSYYSSTDADEEQVIEDKMRWISSSLTKKVDIFSLGCVFSFLLSNGHHPYGDRLVDQHENMEKHKPCLQYCQLSVPAVHDLISWMISIDPVCRPEASECRQHPFFWSDLRLLSFLNATSDYIEKCDKSHELRVTLEMASSGVIGTDWGLFVDGYILNDAGKHRKYNFESMRDYLRLIRNKWNHFSELSLLIRQKLCVENNVNLRSASNFLHYFTQFAPGLVMYCYKLIGSAIKTNEHGIKTFGEYYKEISDYRIQLFYKQVRVNRFRRWYTKH